MPIRRQTSNRPAVVSTVWPSGGRHLWRSGGSSAAQSHERGHLVYAARGVLTIHSDGGTSVVPANRVAWTPAGCTHWHDVHGDTDMRIVFLSPSVARRMPDRSAVFLATGLAREILLALTGGRSDGHADDDANRSSELELSYDGAARARLLRVLVDELREIQEQPLYLPQPRDGRLQAIMRALSERPEDNTSMADLGRAVGASSRTLSRLIRRELGMTFYEWRTHLRIYHALVLLVEGHDITQTAYACGWANPSGFITAFTQIVGSTPGRYQANCQAVMRHL